MGELHLEIIVDCMKREFKVEANAGAPQVAYARKPSLARNTRWITRIKETVRRFRSVRASSSISSHWGKQAKVSFSKAKSLADLVPKEYIPGVEKGLENASLGNGVVAGFPMIDFQSNAR